MALSLEALAALLSVVLFAATMVVAAFGIAIGGGELFGFGLAWGIAIAVIATIQMVVAVVLRHQHDPSELRAFLIGPLYPIAFWTIGVAAALRSQTVALLRGPETSASSGTFRAKARKRSPSRPQSAGQVTVPSTSTGGDEPDRTVHADCQALVGDVGR